MSEKRLAFLNMALRQENKLYRWGSNGEDDTFDCSGLVVFCMRDPAVFGPSYLDRSCSEFWAMPKVGVPRPGDLAVYRNKMGLASHVMICIDGGLTGRVFGACGGDSSTTTRELAAAKGARVQFRRNPNYRVGDYGLLGFVNPFGD